jgi:hypothetical protein
MEVVDVPLVAVVASYYLWLLARASLIRIIRQTADGMAA